MLMYIKYICFAEQFEKCIHTTQVYIKLKKMKHGKCLSWSEIVANSEAKTKFASSRRECLIFPFSCSNFTMR